MVHDDQTCVQITEFLTVGSVAMLSKKLKTQSRWKNCIARLGNPAMFESGSSISKMSI